MIGQHNMDTLLVGRAGLSQAHITLPLWLPDLSFTFPVCDLEATSIESMNRQS